MTTVERERLAADSPDGGRSPEALIDEARAPCLTIRG
jgi:hypothetical protein